MVNPILALATLAGVLYLLSQQDSVPHPCDDPTYGCPLMYVFDNQAMAEELAAALGDSGLPTMVVQTHDGWGTVIDTTTLNEAEREQAIMTDCQAIENGEVPADFVRLAYNCDAFAEGTVPSTHAARAPRGGFLPRRR